MGDKAVDDVQEGQVGQKEKHGGFQRGSLQNCHNYKNIPREEHDIEEQQGNTKE